MNIYEKISKITDELGVIAKGLKVQVNKTASYNAVSERDVLDAVKPLEKEYGVCSMPVSRKIVDNDILVKETTYDGTTTKTNTLFMRVETTYRFINIEEPTDFIETIVYGDGLDTGDKAPGKAMTYADKYALMKVYKISTGDDPDKEASPEQGYSKNEDRVVSERQLALLEKIYTGDNLEKVLNKYNIEDLSQMPFEIGKELIAKNIKKGE